MGTVLLVARLAWRDLRRRRAEAVLLLAAVAVTAATLTLGLAVRGAAGPSWERTRAVTGGPDAVATAGRATDLGTLAHVSGVRATAGPYPMVSLRDLRVRGITVSAVVQGRDPAPTALDRPEVTDGTWVRGGGVVVERAFARALGVTPGDTISLAGRRFAVAGVAVTSARPPYPSATPGLIWAARSDLRTIGHPTSYVMPLRLTATSAAPAFAAAHRGVRSTQDIGAYATAELRLVDGALLTGAWALAPLAVACVAVLVGGRLAEQVRRVGLLKAVGATPRLVAAVLLAEHVLLAGVAGLIGLLAGQAAAPLLVRPSPGLADLTGRPGVRFAEAVLVAAASVGIVAAATLVPAVRGARISTVRALTGTPRTPNRRSRLVAASARLPVPLLLGVRLAARRPRRTVLAVASLTITVATVVAAIALHGETARKDATGVDLVPGSGNPVTEQLGQAVTVIMVALLTLAAVNAILIAWAGSLDSLRATALARALGATPWQVTAGLSAAQLFPAAGAAVLGVPLGVLVYDAARVAGGAQGPPAVPYAWLPAVVPGTLVAVALLTAVPVRLAGRRPVARILGAG